jgi:hypothetical protein
MKRSILFTGALALSSIPSVALAQESSADQNPPVGEASDPAEIDEDAEEAEEIVVVGRRDPNAVIGDIPPENRLNARDIRAYGATSVSELLDALAPQLGSSRGRGGGQPVVLLNGRRISGFREVRDLPPEAILRLDILPEEVALKYGYRADQRVVNIVLRPRFRSTTARVETTVPTGGGSLSGESDLTRLLIGESSRTTLNARVEGDSALTEAERDIRFDPATPDAIDPRPFRTLVGERRLARVGATHNRTLFGDVSSTFDAQVERSDGRSLLGPSLIALNDPLARDTDSLSGHLGVALNGQKDRWRWSLTGAYDIARSVNETDRESAVPIAFSDRARTLTRSGNLDLVLNGPLLTLPAGQASATVRLGADTRDLDSRARRAGVTSESDLGRDRGGASLNLDLPVARRGSVLSALGNLTLNANAEVEQLSDFGTLTTIGAGFFWSPVERLNLITSWTREEGPPTLQQLGDPLLVTPDTRLFDFRRGETVLVEATTGGNRALDADRRNVWKLGLTWQPLEETDLDLRADYVRTRVSNPISSFPGLTEAIEAAFPDRFERDGAGNLLRVNLRPVNFDRSARDELRWGFNYTKPLRSARPPQSFIDRIRAARQQAGGGGAQSDGEGNRPRRAGGGERRGGGGGFGGRGRQGGRLQFSIFHTWALRDEVRIAEGMPTLDYLSGDVIEGGLRPRHRLEADAGYFNNGLGARLSGNWQSGGEVGSGTSELRFNALAKLNLNLFANLGERFALVERYPWLRGTQVRLGVQNILDARQRVRDAAGGLPGSYQPDLLDPQGRTLSLSLRKLFLPPRGFFRRSDGQGAPSR